MNDSTNHRAVAVIRAVCAVCFVGGIAGMIVASLADNNIGAVLTAGIISAIAAVVLLAVSTVATNRRSTVFDEADAEILETEIRRLVASGSNESTLRGLVHRAVELGRRSR
ncbi:MAG: hypothetical protein ACO3B6_03315 [Ilumatobacteraceae bacterium]